MRPFLSSIAAVSLDGVIGVEGKLPWDLPEDLKYFREVTKGKKVLMGRKTYESIGRPLPNRENYVLSRDTGLILPEGVRRVGDLQVQLKEWSENNEGEEIFVIGGEEVYRQTLPWVNKLYLTEVDLRVGHPDGARFPYWDEIRAPGGIVRVAEGTLRFVEIEREERQQQPLSFRFLVFSSIN